MKIYIRITEVRWITIRSKVENMRTKQVRMSDRRVKRRRKRMRGLCVGGEAWKEKKGMQKS